MIITRPLTVKNRWWLQFFSLSLSLSLSLFFLGERELGGGGRVVGREVDYWAERGSDTDDLLGTMNGLHWIHWWMLFTIFEIKSISGGRYERGRLLSRRSTCSWRCIRQHPSFVFFLSFSPPLFLSRIFCVVFFLHFFCPYPPSSSIESFQSCVISGLALFNYQSKGNRLLSSAASLFDIMYRENDIHQLGNADSVSVLFVRVCWLALLVWLLENWQRSEMEERKLDPIPRSSLCVGGCVCVGGGGELDWWRWWSRVFSLDLFDLSICRFCLNASELRRGAFNCFHHCKYQSKENHGRKLIFNSIRPLHPPRRRWQIRFRFQFPKCSILAPWFQTKPTADWMARPNQLIFNPIAPPWIHCVSNVYPNWIHSADLNSPQPDPIDLFDSIATEWMNWQMRLPLPLTLPLPVPDGTGPTSRAKQNKTKTRQ